MTLYDFGGQGPVIHLAVANGFPPETYRPMIEPLTAQYRVVCVLPRALWSPPRHPRELRTWQDMADDLRATLKTHNLSGVIALGHSMGGIASMLAALDEPERFRALIMLDPTVLMPHMLRLAFIFRAFGLGDYIPVAARARRRRRQFASVDAAYTYWKNKPLFANWPDETLRLYVQSVTRPVSPNGHAGGVELAWSPEWEARYFQTIYAASWRTLPRLRSLLPRVPTMIIHGEKTDIFTPAIAQRVKKLLPELPIIEVEGHGHLFPHSAPVQTRQIIAGWLAKQQ